MDIFLMCLLTLSNSFKWFCALVLILSSFLLLLVVVLGLSVLCIWSDLFNLGLPSSSMIGDGEGDSATNYAHNSCTAWIFFYFSRSDFNLSCSYCSSLYLFTAASNLVYLYYGRPDLEFLLPSAMLTIELTIRLSNSCSFNLLFSLRLTFYVFFNAFELIITFLSCRAVCLRSLSTRSAGRSG